MKGRTAVVVLLGTLLAGLGMVPGQAAHAHALTEAKARKALKPVAQELTPSATQAVAGRFPGATLGTPSVGDCTVNKKGHRADCAISFDVKGASSGDMFCGLDARVQFKSAKSSRLKISVGTHLICLTPIPLP